jgi:hypothetical protein
VGKLLYGELPGILNGPAENAFGPGCEMEDGMPGDVTKPGAANAEKAPLAAKPLVAKASEEAGPCGIADVEFNLFPGGSIDALKSRASSAPVGNVVGMM